MDTEALYLGALAKPTDTLGEQHIYTYALHRQLGDLYRNWNRPEDAERSYRRLLQLTQAQPGDMWNTVAREALAEFLVNHKRYEEAASLFEQVIARLEPRQNTAPWLVGESLRNDYFQLGISYYELKHFEFAENNFKKAFAAESNADEPDSNWQSTILVWQWFTATDLKKPAESTRFYQELIRLVQAGLAQPNPNKSLGATLRDLARSFREVQEFSKAEALLQRLPFKRRHTATRAWKPGAFCSRLEIWIWPVGNIGMQLLRLGPLR